MGMPGILHFIYSVLSDKRRICPVVGEETNLKMTVTVQLILCKCIDSVAGAGIHLERISENLLPNYFANCLLLSTLVATTLTINTLLNPLEEQRNTSSMLTNKKLIACSTTLPSFNKQANPNNDNILPSPLHS